MHTLTWIATDDNMASIKNNNKLLSLMIIYSIKLNYVILPVLFWKGDKSKEFSGSGRSLKFKSLLV